LYTAIQSLRAQNFNMHGENIVQPNIPFKILLNYKNVANCNLAIVPYLEKNLHEPDDEYKNRILAQTPIHTYTVDLPNADDLKNHSVEYKINGLPIGRYYLVPLPPLQYVNKYSWLNIDFQVSNIAYVLHQNNMKILDRTNGKPLANAEVTIIYNQDNKQQTLK